nr:glycosyltransferase [Kineococcus siccus]
MRTAAVLPVRGHLDLLAAVLEGLRQQETALDEIVVVDDSPTPVIPPTPGVTVVHSGGAGPYAARNAGVAASAADVVFFLDARSRPTPGWVGGLLAQFADPQVGIAGSQTRVLGGESLAARASEVQQFAALDKYLANPFFLPYLPTCNLAVRRADFDAVGGFSTVRSGGDADLCWRVQQATGHVLAADERVLLEWVPRTDWRELLEQNFRYGGSHHALRVRWADRGLRMAEPLPTPRLVVRSGRAVVRLAAAAPRGRTALAQQFVAVAGACFDWGYWRAHRRALRAGAPAAVSSSPVSSPAPAAPAPDRR